MIQIYGRRKCFDTKKAQRFFQERGVSVQNIDLDKYGMRPKELESVLRAVGDIALLINEKSKLYHSSAIGYLASSQAKAEKLLECPTLFKTPILRNGKAATVGYCPEVWKSWL